MKRRFLTATILFNSLAGLSLAQPAITPATGYKWQSVSTSTYTTGPQKTGCGCGTNNNDSSFGLNLQCPSDLPSTTVAGCPVIQKQVYGNIGENGSNFSSLSVTQNPGCGGTSAGSNWPLSSTATRQVTLTEWTNSNLASAVANGASTGMVCIPTAARIVISDGATCDGSGVGADELRFLVIGGNSGSQSSFDITVNYQLNWSSSQYGGSGSTGAQTVAQNLVVNDAGNGNKYDWALQQNPQTWYFPSGSPAISFGTSLQQNYAVAVGSISQAGGSFTVDFTASASVGLGRSFGNADARVSMGPGFHGNARYEVDYQCWQIVAEAMPVRLVSFNAKAGDGVVNLQWETASEQDNDHFDIEHSTDAKSFEAIGREVGQGTTPTGQHYVFTDKSPLGGANYYRLHQVDTDGSSSYSKIVAVSYDKNQPLLELLGNPAETQSIRLLLKNIGTENLRLTSISGQSMAFDLQPEAGSIYRLVPKNTLTSGTYLLTLREGKTRLSQRIAIK